MALNTIISAAARTAMVQQLQILLDAGAGPGTLKIYTGTQPAGPGTAVGAQVLLGTLTLTDPSFPAGSTGVITASAITSDTTADATGTATWFRASDSNAVAVIDGSVGTATSDLILDSVSIVAGGTIAVTSWTITMPAS
jgi:hypothetical protein